MGIFYIGIGISFAILLIINFTFLVINVIFWATNGLQALLNEKNFIESIYYSNYLKWILLADGIWIAISLSWAFKRKHFKTDTELHYLKNYPIKEPSLCVVIPTFNEESAIEIVVSDFLKQKNVAQVLIVDNNSSDKTVEIATKCGAKVFKKNQNKGFADSCVIGLKEALKENFDATVLVEGDGTCVGHDLPKMLSYLDNCDMVIGTRALQTLSEKNNQLGMIHIWGNYILAKLIQIKFFSLLHMGVVSLSDVGCLYRIIRKDALEKIIKEFTDKETKQVIPSYEFTLFMTMEGLKNNLRIIEVPVSFKKRIGKSKIGSEKKFKAIKIGFLFLWYILKS